WKTRLRNLTLITLPIAIIVGGWIIRNKTLVGVPVLTTEGGESLWIANNEWLLTHFPHDSIDLNDRDSYENMTLSQREELEKLDGDEAARDRLDGQWGLDYIATHRLETLRNIAYKIWVAVSGQFSPSRGGLFQLGYALLFVPVHILAAIGLWCSR